jgi:hypothetical protein
MQERDGGGFLGGFDPVHAASTSLACKSETEVVLWPFDPVHAAATSLACNSETEVGFYAFRPRSRCHHLPRRQERDGGGVYVVSSPFASPPPFSHARARRRWIFTSFRPRSRRRHLPRMQERVRGGFLGGFDPVRAAATSLAYNSESDVGFYGLSTPFAPLLPGFFLMHSVAIRAFRATTTRCLSGTALS